MSGERGPISIEEVSRSMALADSIKSSGLIGEKSGSQADIAEQKAQELLKSKFLPSSYESVIQIKEVVNNPSSSEIQKANARKALTDLGSALIIADPKLLDKIGQIDANVPPSLRGISEEVFKNWFVNGPDDEIGKSLVASLSEVETFNLKVKRAPNVYGPKRAQVVEGQMDAMMGMFDSVEEDSLDGLKIGAVVGYLDGMVKVSAHEGGDSLVKAAEKIAQAAEKTAKAAEKMSGTKSRYKDEQERYGLRPVFDAEGNQVGMESNYNVSAENCAKAMKWMASDLRWSTWTAPEWFNVLPDEQKGKILSMIAVNTAAANMAYAGKDLLKILESNSIFGFTKEDMASLFDHDFKLVMSKMLNDLCEISPDNNGVQSLRYKEVFYEVDANGDKIKNPDGSYKRAYAEGPGVIRTIDAEVMHNLSYREDYKEKLASFLASQNGREKPNYMDQMTAYTAWNLFYGMGDSSTCDRMRILPTWNGIICDGIRTMKKSEFKAKNKWQIWKGGKVGKDSNLLAFENFGGNLGDYVRTVMDTESVIGAPVTGDKTLREKALSGEFKFFNETIFYGLLDFVNGGRDLVMKGYNESLTKEYGDNNQKKFFDKQTGQKREVTLAQLLMDYAYENSPDGRRVFIDKDRETERHDFSFGLEQTTFMNEFRDSLEGGILAYNCMTSKEEMKTVSAWVRRLREKIPMISGIDFNGRRAFSYTTSPMFWRDVMIGTIGYDDTVLSTDYIKLKNIYGKDDKMSYGIYLKGMFETMGLVNGRDVDFYELANLLGLRIERGKKFNSPLVASKNDVFFYKERKRTEKLTEKYDVKIMSEDRIRSDLEKLRKIEGDVMAAADFSRTADYDTARLYADFKDAVKWRQLVKAQRLSEYLIATVGRK